MLRPSPGPAAARRRWIFILACLGLFAGSGRAVSLEEGRRDPPPEARLRAYWFWLNGNVTRASIRRDLEEMKAKGFGGAVMIDANNSVEPGVRATPHGPTFFTPEWRDLYRYTLREAHRLGLQITLTPQGGWNLGGPGVPPEDAIKKYVWSETQIAGGGASTHRLARPEARDDFYRDTAVLAYRLGSPSRHAPLAHFAEKSLQRLIEPFSTPDTSPLFAEIPATPGEEDAPVADVVDLTGDLQPDGLLRWQAPTGLWQIFRFGYTLGDFSTVKAGSDGWHGYALDVYDAGAFQRYWDRIVEPLIADAGPFAGNTLAGLFTDSWEIELASWTPGLREEFQRRRGYDPRPWLPVLAGRILNSREDSDRFLFDYRRTLGDLVIDHHYRLFRDNAHRHGLMMNPESGGPHAVAIDSQRCLGWNDEPMSEFWAHSPVHRVVDSDRFFVKQPASAAHTYGHRYVLAEGFTTSGQQWQEKLYDNLKPTFEQALCEGLNVLVWHAFVCSPDETGVPGQQYNAGTHLNPKVTWWGKSAAFFSYINRCQWLLQQGHFAADALYYYGDHVPNFAQLKRTDPAQVGSGYDYDVATEETLLDDTTVRNGRIHLRDGMEYRVLVLPDRDQIALPALEKIAALAAAGATIVGPRPARAETLQDRAGSDQAVRALAERCWGAAAGDRRIISERTARDVLRMAGVPPDCDFPVSQRSDFDFIHRSTEEAEIYFVANRANAPAGATVAFRVAGRAPELWDPVTGEIRFAPAYRQAGVQTLVPLTFAPCGSWFVVFRAAAAAHPAGAASNEVALHPLAGLTGSWTVRFDPKWGGPAETRFASLTSWPDRPEPGIRFYSGTARYEKRFTVPAVSPGRRLFLDLGAVRELAEVKVNGRSCGTVWCPPWRVEVTSAVTAGENSLAIEVVNFWPNRLIGDAALPPAQRLTRTNVDNPTAATPLEPAGLLGPVTLQEEVSAPAAGTTHPPASAAGAGAREWSPLDYRAARDGRTYDTTALQAAIDAAHHAGGGTVRVPAGVYLTGTLELRSGVTLNLEKDAVLLGGPRVADYRRGNWPALIKAKGQRHIALVGAGTVNGQGRAVAADTLRIDRAGTFLEYFPDLRPGETLRTSAAKGEGAVFDPWALQKEGRLGEAVFTHRTEDGISRANEFVRPQLLEFWDCQDVRVAGITLQDAACWVETYRECEDVLISGIKVRSTSYWNNDGIDVVDCRRVRIEACDIDAADDGICLKSESNRGACTDITVDHCRIRSSASAFKIGTASRGAFRHIRVHDLEIRDTFRSAVALESVDGATLEDVLVDGVTARHTGNAFALRLGHRNDEGPVGTLRHIRLSHFRVEVPAGPPDAGYETAGPAVNFRSNLMPSSITGLPGHPVEDVSLSDIEITTAGGGRRDVAEVPLPQLSRIPEQANHYPEFSMFGELPAWGLYFRHASGLRLENVTLRFLAHDFRAALVADDVQGLALSHLHVPAAGDEAPVVLRQVTGETIEALDLPAGTEPGIERL